MGMISGTMQDRALLSDDLRQVRNTPHFTVIDEDTLRGCASVILHREDQGKEHPGMIVKYP